MTPTNPTPLPERIRQCQLVADRVGLTVHLYASGEAHTREQPHLGTPVAVLHPAGSLAAPLDAPHGLGDGEAHTYATPSGDGSTL